MREYEYLMTTRAVPACQAWVCGLILKPRPDAPAGEPVAFMGMNAAPDLPIYRDGEGNPDALHVGDLIDPNTAPLVLIPCSAEAYQESLEVLWPALWEGPGFLVGEPWTHKGGRAAYQAFFKLGAAPDHYRANVPLTKAEFRALTPADLAAAIARGRAG